MTSRPAFCCSSANQPRQGRQVAIAQEIMARNAKGAPVARLPEDALVRSSPAAAQLAAEA